MIIEVISSSIVIVASVLIYKIIIAPRFSVLNKLPGPKPSSLIMGNFPEIAREEVIEPQLRWVRQYGDILKYNFIFNNPSVLISGPNELKHVLVTNAQNYKYQLTGADKLVYDFFGEGLLLIHGEKHKAHKRTIQPVFNYTHLKHMVPMFLNKMNVMLKRIEKLSEKGVPELDMSQEVSNIALDIIGQAAFAYNFDAVNDDKGEMTEKYKTFMRTFELGPHLFIPGWRSVPTPWNLKLKKAMNDINKVLYDIIAKKKASIARNEKKDLEDFDMLDLILRAEDEETGEKFDDKQIHNHVMTFVLAGHETTATAMAWLIYNISQNPEVEQKLVEELNANLKGKENLTYDDFEKLPYFENVIKESLRLHPSAPITTRMTIEDDVISGYKIPKGTRIVICPGVNQRLEKYWGENPEKFNPDRWNDPKTKELPLHAYMPFLMGPRTCIGFKFAKLEMKAVIALLYMKYTFKLKPGHKVERRLAITMKPSPSLLMTVHPRK